jgi:hypothetical protein
MKAHPSTPAERRPEAFGAPFLVTAAVFVVTVGQLLVGTFAGGLAQFEGKAFGARLVAYPLLMLVVPALWLLVRRRSGGPRRDPPWAAFGLIMAPFLIDVTGNTLDLYDSIGWWDDANHFVNWFLLCTGIGLLLLRARVADPAVLGLLIVGAGALLAIGWELGEWFTFIRHGTELDTAYEDTLGDQTLGVLGAAVAGGLVAWRARSGARAGGPHRPRME